ncbi:unnamed protein product [Rotaria magnacalcarata]|uniref:Uncharacterized protein n=3 Tax=Rotaria magnacalcarata TaxID=392030 RepID=A0A818ZNA5_9BILA|nr:unnamed protein product [Rotaria magnacalcarata]CAF2051951.1 unnamed protein product [Rotaria magnacalcarata]CAF3771499.1 unnamed protein product [Rotaria magnacalcarata]
MAQNNNDNKRSQKVKFQDQTVKIQTVIINGIECLRLKDVQRKFPKAQILSIDNEYQAFLHDERGNDLEPLRIIACFDQIVEAEESVKPSYNEIRSDLKEIKGIVKRVDNNVQEMLRQIRYVMTQMYELHEFTTPRYFFILPAKHSDIKAIDFVQNWFQTHYKLHFLCECSHDPKQMHVAPHEGYSIKKARDFIVKYAPYLRTTLQIVQVLLSAGGLAIPQLGSAAKVIDSVVPSKFKDTKYFEDMKQQLEMVDHLLNKVENQRNHAGASVTDGQKSKGTPLQGAELREIQTYLELVDDKRTLGNLYRIVTDDGHVRWVCLEHYDEISYNTEMSKYINEFEATGGKFDQKTKEAFIRQVDVTSKNVEMMCKALGKGFNIVELIFEDCLISEDDLEKLLDIIINRSSIRCLNMVAIRVRNFFGIVKYTCQDMVADFNNQTFKVRFSQANRRENTMMLTLLLLQNKIYRNLDFSANDYLNYESDLRRSFEGNAVLTHLSLEYSNNSDILNSVLNLKKNALYYLKLTHSLCVPSTSSHFCEMLKKNKTLLEIDLMDTSGFEDEAFINDLLETLRNHKSIKHLNLHVRNIRPTDEKEICLMKSLRKEKFISRLCISSSIVSHEFTEALLHASKEYNALTHLAFYNCKMENDDQAALQALYDDGSLPQLAFYPEPRWDVILQVTNGSLNRVISTIPANAKWAQNGVTVAGGKGLEKATSQLYRPHGLFLDDDQTVVIADYWKHRIIQWKKGDTANGQVVAGGNGQGNRLNQLNEPTDVLIDKETDSLIIGDRNNQQVV